MRLQIASIEMTVGEVRTTSAIKQTRRPPQSSWILFKKKSERGRSRMSTLPNKVKAELNVPGLRGLLSFLESHAHTATFTRIYTISALMHMI